jgi:hypothetical protein
MKFVKVAGIAWGLIYFAVGASKSFTLNSIDFWSGVVFFGATFLLPLPIALVAVWFPRIAGRAMLGCAAVSIAAVVSVVVSRPTSPLTDVGRFIAFTVLYNIPLVFFGLVYILAARPSKDADSGDERPSVGVA